MGGTHRVARTSIVGLVGVALLLAGSLQRTPPTSAETLSPAETAAVPITLSAAAAAAPKLPPLRSLIRPTVLVTADAPLPDDVVRRLVATSGSKASLSVAVGDVQLARGRTRALAADPVRVRAWTPAVTGRVDAVWQRALVGDALFAHAVAKAQQIPLGSLLTLRGPAGPRSLRAGGFASSELPGIGVVVGEEAGRRLGLRSGTGLLLAAPRGDTAATAALLRRELGPRASVEVVLAGTRESGSWGPPVVGRVTSPFGMRVHPLRGEVAHHDGIDVGAPLGAPVYAMSDGQVLYAGPASGFGNEIVLSHAGGVTTVYGHVSRILVTSGSVQAGQVIALVGNEGESTGPHLHAEVHVRDRAVDPVAWLRAHGVSFG